MDFSLSHLALWQKVLLGYLLVGYCTQLPGIAFGYFLFIPRFRHLQQSSIFAKFIAGIGWLLFTTLLWPTTFLRVGLNLIAIELVVLGLIGTILLLTMAKTIPWIVGVIVAITIASLVLARRRRLRG